MVRKFERSDSASVHEIEKLCFTDPWSEESAAAEADNALGTALVYDDGGVCGYVFGDFDGEDAYISRIAVRPDRRRQGIARILLTEFKERTAGESGQISLEVRAGNETAAAFDRSMGFEAAAVRRRFYASPSEDAVVMIRRGKICQ